MKSKVLCIASVLLCLALLIGCAACANTDNAITSSTATSSKKAPSYITQSKNQTTVSRLQSEAYIKNTKIKIMPMGDSLTQGGNESAYRASLAKKLTDAGYNFSFVGSHNWSSGAIVDGNNMHSGYGGINVKGLSAELVNMIGCNPDVVLLMIGRNDVTQSISATDTVNDIDALLVDKLYNLFPDVHIFLASPPPMRAWDGGEFLNLQWDKAITEYAPAYKAYVERKKNEGFKIDYVDMGAEATNLTWEDFTKEDFVHPLPSGYDKMASQWFNNITATLDEIKVQKEKTALQSSSK